MDTASCRRLYILRLITRGHRPNCYDSSFKVNVDERIFTLNKKYNFVANNCEWQTLAKGLSAKRDLRVFKQKQMPATARNMARNEITVGASTWASKNSEVSSVSGGCSSCIRLLPVGDSVLNRYSACVEPALLYAVTRSSYLVPLCRPTIGNLDCGGTLFDTATELGSLCETDLNMLRATKSFRNYFGYQNF